MSNRPSEATTSFAEVFASAGIPTQMERTPVADTRIILYCHGMKVSIPDRFQPETLEKLLRILKQL